MPERVAITADGIPNAQVWLVELVVQSTGRILKSRLVP